MKVVQINAVYGYGSTGVIVKDLEQAILETNNDSFIVYQSSNDNPVNGWQMGNSFDWKLHALMTRVTGRQAYFSVKATADLVKALKKEKPDIVHLHNTHSNYINLQMLLKYLADENIATVLTLHDCWFFTGKCFHFVNCGCEKWQSRCEICPQNKSDVKSWFVDASSKVFDDRLKYMQSIKNLTVVGCSKWITELAQRSPIFKEKSFKQIYNGVDTSIFKQKNREELRDKYNLSNKFVILGMANKWFLEMNSDILNNFLSTLNENEILFLVGCSTEQKQQVSEYKNVVTIDFVSDREKLAEIYNVADVFINLSFEDTLPTVNMEAVCCGTPVITYNVCGCPELVDENTTGYIVPTLDFDAIKCSVEKIKQGNLSRTQCANYGKNFFDKNKQYQQYISLYEKICNK